MTTKKIKNPQKINKKTFKILEFASMHTAENIFEYLNKSSNGLIHASKTGLNKSSIYASREIYGDNVVTHQKKQSLGTQLFKAFINPFTLILLVLAGVSCFMDIILPLSCGRADEVSIQAVVIICAMVFLSGILRFVQESRSGAAAELLLSMITTTCSVIRKNKHNEEKKKEIPLDKVVVGDIVTLSAGDMIPADVRILEAKDLFINQSSLTGESEPIEKIAKPLDKIDSITDRTNLAFMGSNVLSGQGSALVLATGDSTLFGSVASEVASQAPETNFTKGVNKVSWVLIRFMLIMVPIVFFVNGFTKGDWLEVLLFGISIAVGLTPEMLPMIVSTCLAKGAVIMSKKKTIVKNLNAIQSFGAINILCTDKTGTITQDEVVLEYHINVHGKEDDRILRHAYLNSYFQTGYKNLMDIAIINKTEELELANPKIIDLSQNYTKIDEMPFDFVRRRLSVVVQDTSGKTQMITKGAVEEMLSICSFVEYDSKLEPLSNELKQEILQVVDDLNKDGFRVIALAQKNNPSQVGAFGVKDECDMVLLGYLAFLDPPKSSAKLAITALRDHGVMAKVLTGDNPKVAQNICKQVGLQVGINGDKILLGHQIEQMSDEELAVCAIQTEVFAKLSPDQKVRIVKVLQDLGHSVGFMGDGINDVPALKIADVGISVDSAVDIAKESADIILLEKDLMVLEEGIIEGRKTYANMIKYIKMTASSNFGNMFSVLAASVFLPFIPMMPLHLLILNLIYDISCMSLPWDNVDKEILKTPQNWDSKSVSSFMLWFGPVSSVFDWSTYVFMYFVCCPMFVSGGVLYNDLVNVFAGDMLATMQLNYEAMFQAGWFIESMWSQMLIIHMLRTSKIPFVQSSASAPVMFFTLSGIIALTIIPFTQLANALGFVALPSWFFWYLIPCVVLYMLLATLVKVIYIRCYGKLL